MTTNNQDDKSALVAQKDTEDLSPLQELLHTWPKEKGEPEKPIISLYTYEEKVLTFASITDHKMNCRIAPSDNEDTEKIMYEVDCGMHKLRSVFAVLPFGEIAVGRKFEDRVQIALCPNFMSNYISRARLTIYCGPKAEYNHEINTFVHDSYRARDCDDVSTYDYSVGNREELINWSTVLKTPDPLLMPLNFFMNAGYPSSIPLHLYKKHNSIQITVFLQRDITRYIQMRMKNSDGVWIKIPQQEIDLSFLRISKPSFPLPQLWGRYSTLNEFEIADEAKNGYSIVITDYEHLIDQNITGKLITTIPRELSCVRGLRYAFLNNKATLFNYHSNYSSDHNDRTKGHNPEQYHSLTCGELERIPKRESIHSSLVPALYSFRSTCGEKRFFNDLVWDHYPYASGVDSSILPRVNKFTLILRDNQSEGSNMLINDKKEYKIPISDIEAEKRIDRLLKRIKNNYTKGGFLDDSPSSSFVFKAYCRVTKRITFSEGNIVVENE